MEVIFTWISVMRALIKRKPSILFFILLILSLCASYKYQWLVYYTADLLESNWGENIIPRFIVGALSSLFIASYIAERDRGRDAKLVQHGLNFVTSLSLCLGIYTLFRWIFLDSYGTQSYKFLPYIGKLDGTVLVAVLLLLINEVTKGIASEAGKLKMNREGTKVTPVLDEDAQDEIVKPITSGKM